MDKQEEPRFGRIWSEEEPTQVEKPGPEKVALATQIFKLWFDDDGSDGPQRGERPSAPACIREQPVKEKDDIGETIVSRDDGVYSVFIFTTGEDILKPISPDAFHWHKSDPDDDEFGCKFLTLREIAQQWEMTHVGQERKVLYVWAESPTHGTIYQYGNYPENLAWVKHGTTKGYA